MAETKIEWAEKVWNPVTGCSPISEGCDNCYARRMANRLKGRCGYPADEPFRVTFHRNRLVDPIMWKKPQCVFVCSMGDIFHKDVDKWWLDDVLDSCLSAPQHTYIFLTKRPFNIIKKLDGCSSKQIEFMATKAWLGVTAENQRRADERIPILLQIPAAVRFVSVEPMLGPVDLRHYLMLDDTNGTTEHIEKNGWGFDEWSGGALGRGDSCYDPMPGIDGVICGGETGPGARPMHPDWARSLRDQCVETRVPFFFKSWGAWKGAADFNNGNMVAGSERKLRLLDGREWNEVPMKEVGHGWKR